MRALRSLVAAIAFAFAVAVLAPGSTSDAGSGNALPELLPLRATHGPGAAIVDAEGRQVLLRGVNLSALGDYYLPNPAYPAPVPLKPDDFPDMAAEGFNVVRLLVHWSALEPERDVIDDAYLQDVRDAVATAAANGIYVVIDMHQDAWGKHIASPPGTVCPAGTTPAIGWDGAPEWATLFDPGAGDVNTCRGGSREDSNAVRHAWDNFYADTAGIQSELIELWGMLGAEFADEPAVAGYDLLNEPNEGTDPEGNIVRLGEFYDAAIDAIRAGEAAEGGFSHIAIFETSVFGRAVPVGFTDDTNVVFSGHNYAESFLPVDMSIVFTYFGALAEQYGAPLWIGEFGWFSDPPANAEKVVRYGDFEDELLLGGAWWQWIQACGDPHSISTQDGTPAGLLIHYKASECPGDVDLGPVPEWSVVRSRPYPRAVPGALTSLSSDGAQATMAATGSVPGSGRFDVWVPDRGTGAPTIGGKNVSSAEVVEVEGGWRVLGRACGDYRIEVNQGSAVSGSCAPGTGDGGSGDGSTTATPRFTG